jgi:hypothetical protein
MSTQAKPALANTRKEYWAAYHRKRYQTDAEHRERKRAQARAYSRRKRKAKAS